MWTKVTATLFVLCLVAASPASFADVRESLFKIRASACADGVDNKRLTGFAMDGTDGILTSLHGVVGCRIVTAQQSGSNGIVIQDLRITEVDIDRDVAVLNADETPPPNVLGLVRAKESDRPIGLKVWGFPMGVREPFDTNVALRSVQFTSWNEMTPEARLAMRERGSPGAGIRMLSIQGPVTTGHSGSPILNADGAVMGITNGGLAGGTIDVALAAPIWDLSFRPATALRNELQRLGALGSAKLFMESDAVRRGKDALKEEVAMSLQAQADGVAERARSYVSQALKPLIAGDGTAWWSVNVGVVDTFKKVEFKDHKTGWVLGKQSLLSTSDGGNTWTKKRSDKMHFNDFDFVGDKAVWLVGNDGLVFHMRGDTGSRQKTDTTSHIHGVDFLEDGVTGWVVGDSGLLLFTADGGTTWKVQTSGTDRNLIKIHAFDSRTAWVGGASITLLTTDGGLTWKTMGTDKTFTDVQFFDQTTGLTVENSLFYRTSDGGRNWQQNELRGRRIAVRGFSFLDPHHGWLGNLYGEVIRTRDAGATWSIHKTGANRLNDVCFVDESNGWAVGDDGAVVHTAALSLSVDGKTPSEVLSMLQASVAHSYFEREGILKRLEGFVDQHEALVAAFRRATGGETPFPIAEPPEH